MAGFGQERAMLYHKIIRKEYIVKQIQKCIDYVSEHCFYCKSCCYCLVTKKLQKEADLKKLKTSNIEWWSIKWKKNKKRQNIPQLVSHGKNLW